MYDGHTIRDEEQQQEQYQYQMKALRKGSPIYTKKNHKDKCKTKQQNNGCH